VCSHDLGTVHIRHGKIDDQQVWIKIGKHGKRLAAAADVAHIVTKLGELWRRQFGDFAMPSSISEPLSFAVRPP
jgi:hypothetical protein